MPQRSESIAEAAAERQVQVLTEQTRDLAERLESAMSELFETRELLNRSLGRSSYLNRELNRAEQRAAELEQRLSASVQMCTDLRTELNSRSTDDAATEDR